MELVRDVTTWYLAATSGDKKKKKNKRNNVLDVTEILCLRRKNCRASTLIIHFSLLTKGKELVEIGYIM